MSVNEDELLHVPIVDMWTYDELKEYSFTKDTLQYPYSTQKKLFEKRVANILDTQRKRITLDIRRNTIIIDVTKNRNVAITLPKLFMLQELFGADDIVIMTPIRCKITLKMIRTSPQPPEEDESDGT